MRNGDAAPPRGMRRHGPNTGRRTPPRWPASYNDAMFVHLRLHTEFSVVDGTTRIDEVVAAAKADRQPALAITDLNNLFGGVKFYKEARGAGVKPVLGTEV